MPDIRRARPDEAAAVNALTHAAYAHYVPRIGREPKPMRKDHAHAIEAGQVWVTEQDGVLQGVLVLVPEAGILLLENIAVAPAAQGIGLGRALLQFAEEEARRRAYGAIRLYTNAVMTENQAIYAARGYRETHRATTPSGLHVVYMRKDLR